jgi:hypothetical protein
MTGLEQQRAELARGRRLDPEVAVLEVVLHAPLV